MAWSSQAFVAFVLATKDTAIVEIRRNSIYDINFIIIMGAEIYSLNQLTNLSIKRFYLNIDKML